MDFSSKALQAKVTHPSVPDVWVELRQIDELDAIDISNTFARAGRLVAIIDPRTSEPIRTTAADGTVTYGSQKLSEIPAHEILEADLRFVVDLGGLTVDGVAVRYAGENDDAKRAVLRKFFMKPALRVEREITDAVTGEKRTTWVSFGQWIVEQAVKPETFGITSGKT